MLFHFCLGTLPWPTPCRRPADTLQALQTHSQPDNRPLIVGDNLAAIEADAELYISKANKPKQGTANREQRTGNSEQGETRQTTHRGRGTTEGITILARLEAIVDADSGPCIVACFLCPTAHCYEIRSRRPFPSVHLYHCVFHISHRIPPLSSNSSGSGPCLGLHDHQSPATCNSQRSTTAM